MQMDQRVRSLTTHYLSGEVYTAPGGVKESLGFNYIDSPVLDCTDFWHKIAREDGSLPPSDCQITMHFRDPLRMNRVSPPATFGFVDYSVSNQGTTSVAGFDSVRPALGTPQRVAENSELALELLAASNPLRAEFSIPVAIKELTDLSSLFKISCQSFAGFIGSNYLSYKFGWVQFLNDLKTLHKITVAIERRIKEFDSLNRKGGLRRKIQLRSKTASYLNPSSVIQSSWGVNITAKVVGRYQCQTHGTVRWRYKDEIFQSLHKLTGFNQAVAQVFDLGQLDSQTAWNLIPFSWLVDYFVDLNTYLGAGLGSGIIEPYDICIVRKSESRFSQQVLSKPSTISLTGMGKYGRNLYERDVVGIASLTLPNVGLFTWDHTFIIAALIASFKR